MGQHRVLTASAALACLVAGRAGPAAAEEQRNGREERPRQGEDALGARAARRDVLSGRVQRGEASYHHPRLQGRPMANGERFDAGLNSAASRTLPLGTTAPVTNTETGR